MARASRFKPLAQVSLDPRSRLDRKVAECELHLRVNRHAPQFAGERTDEIKRAILQSIRHADEEKEYVDG
jgi:hypothetical protein